MLPAMLSRDSTVPHFLRMIGAAPAVYLLIGVGVWEAFRFLRERCFRQSGLKSSVVLATVAGGLILMQGVSTYRTYFDKWAVAPQLADAYDLEWESLASVLNALPSNASTAYLIPTFHSPYSFQYLYQGTAPAYLLHPSAPDLARKVEFALSGMEEVSAVKVVQWKAGVAGVGGDTGGFAFLLSKYGRYRNSDEYPDFHVHTYTDISLGGPWTFYENLEAGDSRLRWRHRAPGSLLLGKVRISYRLGSCSTWGRGRPLLDDFAVEDGTWVGCGLCNFSAPVQ